MEIGFIGLGNMGGRIARRLAQSGHDLVVYDLNQEAVDAVVAHGARAARSPNEVASTTAVVMCCLPTPDVVEAVITGDGGVITGGAVRTVVDLSTSGPTTSGRVAERLTESGIAFLDAPVSGGTPGAEAGTLVVMTSGEADTLATVRPALEDIAKQVVHLGERPGLGQAMKLVNNMLAATCAIASFEALVVGTKAGLDAAAMIEVINGSSGRNYATEVKIPQCVLTREFPPRFTTGLLHKDVTLGIREAETLGVPISVIPAVRQFLQFAITQGDGSRDYAHTIKHLEGWAGVQVGEPPETP